MGDLVHKCCLKLLFTYFVFSFSSQILFLIVPDFFLQILFLTFFLKFSSQTLFQNVNYFYKSYIHLMFTTFSQFFSSNFVCHIFSQILLTYLFLFSTIFHNCFSWMLFDTFYTNFVHKSCIQLIVTNCKNTNFFTFFVDIFVNSF